MEEPNRNITETSIQLPDELRNEAVMGLKKVSAFIGSNGDATVLESFKEAPSLVFLLGITFVLGLVAYIISEIANYQDIRRNWSTYRCHPSITPFAKFYGHDLEETMNFCIGQAVKEHAPGVIDPIYSGIEKVVGVVDDVYTKAEAIEGGVAGLLNGFESFVINFMNSFRLVGVRIHMSLVRIKDIFARVYGTFIAFSYAAISAITFGENLICNPLVTFVAGIAGVDICCFHPATRILMEDGSILPISAVKIGHTVAGGGAVTSTYIFDGTDVSMYNIRGVYISGNHYIFGENGIEYAEFHPEAVQIPSLPLLCCLTTSTHQIPVLDNNNHILLCADYEESSDSEVISEAQWVAEASLNGVYKVGPTVEDYSLGIDPQMEILMMNGGWKQLDTITIGDAVANGGCIIGIIQETCNEVCITPGGHYVSPAQLILHCGIWKRAVYVWPKQKEQHKLSHIMVNSNNGFIFSDNGTLYGTRDYTEVKITAIQEPYTMALKHQNLNVHTELQNKSYAFGHSKGMASSDEWEL